jgi:hypothetical protein
MRELKRDETRVTEEYCWAITSGGALMLRSIRLRCVGLCI